MQLNTDMNVLRRCGIVGGLPPGLATVNVDTEANRLMMLTVHAASQHAWGEEWYVQRPPQKFAAMFTDAAENRERAKREIDEIMECMWIVENISIASDHPHQHNAQQLLRETQFQNLTLYREANLEYRLNENTWPDYVLDDLRDSWFSLLDNTVYTVEDMLGEVKDEARKTRNKSMSLWRTHVLLTE